MDKTRHFSIHLPDLPSFGHQLMLHRVHYLKRSFLEGGSEFREMFPLIDR